MNIEQQKINQWKEKLEQLVNEATDIAHDENIPHEERVNFLSKLEDRLTAAIDKLERI